MGAFADSLVGEQEVQISFVKKDGKKRTIPIWFTVEGSKLELLPMYGFRTKWYKAVEASGKVEVRTKKQGMTAKPRIVKDSVEVDRIKERFGTKYGVSDVRKYYPTSDVALIVQV